MQSLGQIQLSKSTSRKLLHLIAIRSNLIAHQQTLHSFRRLVPCPPLLNGRGQLLLRLAPLGIAIINVVAKAAGVMLEFVLFGGEVIHPRTEEFEVFLEVGVRAEIKAVKGGVSARSLRAIWAVESVAHVAKEGADEAGVAEGNGHLLEDVAGIDEIVLPRLSQGDGLIRESVALEDEVSVGGLHGIVEHDNGIGTEIGLVGQLIFEEG
mmetsp:Transcript_26449/g.45123  ORF Transcript_26449/g.45123 Transcript_26449/m.45123 type:complete len:209 (-) Transcript_26449:546-1172(-)